MFQKHKTKDKLTETQTSLNLTIYGSKLGLSFLHKYMDCNHRATLVSLGSVEGGDELRWLPGGILSADARFGSGVDCLGVEVPEGVISWANCPLRLSSTQPQ